MWTCSSARTTRAGANGSTASGSASADWLSQDGVNSSALRGATNEHFIASCYYFNSVKILSHAEGELGYGERAERYARVAEEIRQCHPARILYADGAARSGYPNGIRPLYHFWDLGGSGKARLLLPKAQL